MKYKTKSVLIGRRKVKGAPADMPYVVDVKLFDINDPHKSTVLPKESIEFKDVEDVIIEGFKVRYCILGNDILINDADEVEIKKVGPWLDVKKC